MRMTALLGLAVAVLAGGAGQADAGTLSESSDPRCDYLFSGPVETGDLAKIEELGGGPSDWPVICLDSPGGRLTEAARMFEHIWRENIGTAVLPGHSCLSACAIVFLGGSYSTGSDVTYHFDRTLWADGTLGFHSPSLELPAGGSYSAAQVGQAFEGALSAARLIYRINQTVARGNRAMSDYLYYQILSTPPSRMKTIDTVADAVLSDIAMAWEGQVPKTVDPLTVADETIDFVCRNYLAGAELAESFREPTTDAGAIYDSFLSRPAEPMRPTVAHATGPWEERFLVGPYFAATKYFDYYCLIAYLEEDVFDPDLPADAEPVREGSFSVVLHQAQTPPRIDELGEDAWNGEAKLLPFYYRFDPRAKITDAPASEARLVRTIPRFSRYGNRDLPGLDIARKAGVDADGCLDFCAATPGCDTVVHDRWNRLCFAKAHEGRTQFRFSASSDVLTRHARGRADDVDPAQLGFARRKGRMFEGEEIMAFDTTPTGQCEELCSQEESCSAYDVDGPQCRLFSTTRTHLPGGAGSAIGYKSQR